MYNKFKVGESEMCPCNADIMTAEHLQQHCRLHDAVRWDTWPEPTLLRDKLYGKPGGDEEDSRLCEGNRHLHLAHDEEEEEEEASATTILFARDSSCEFETEGLLKT